MRRGLYLLPAIAIVLATCPPGVHAGEDEETPAVKIVLHPAPEPRPALEYQLLPEFLDRRPGNAAVEYGKVTAEQSAVFRPGKLWQDIMKWRKAPLEDLRRDQVSKKVGFGVIFETLDRAARCQYCDWQLPIGEQPGERAFYGIHIPEAQQTRGYGWLLEIRARVQIAEGQFDQAVRTFQSGYALGRHVAQGQTLVHSLLGVSISGMMSSQLHVFVQQPEAPNLYWALTSLPRPLIDLRPAIEAEMSAIDLSFPLLRDVQSVNRTPDEWRQSLHQLWREFVRYLDSVDVRTMERPEVLTALCLKGYPKAKRALIDRGFPPDEVEAMPVAQVVALYTKQTYEDLRDDIVKWFYLPFWEADQAIDDAEQRLLRSHWDRKEIIPVADQLVPAVQAAFTAVARTDREIAVLRLIEALRIYGAGHQGHLPQTLSDLPVPIPIDPVTGTPFDYQLRGDTALVQGPPLQGRPFRYEIRFARP